MTLYQPFYLEPFEVEVRDLSAGGMTLFSSESLPLYFEFGLEFKLPGTNVIQAKAKAMHQVKQEVGYEVGIIFSEIEEPIRRILDNMGLDYQACEDRIRKEEEDVCRKDCSFLSLCQKKEKG